MGGDLSRFTAWAELLWIYRDAAGLL